MAAGDTLCPFKRTMLDRAGSDCSTDAVLAGSGSPSSSACLDVPLPDKLGIPGRVVLDTSAGWGSVPSLSLSLP